MRGKKNCDANGGLLRSLTIFPFTRGFRRNKKKRRTEHTLGHQSLRQQVTCATGSFLLLLPISPVLICMADNSYIVVVAPVDISVCILHSRAGFSLLPSDDISQKSTARN